MKVDPLGSSEFFPPVERYVYFDAASVGLTHKAAAETIADWQRMLAEDGTVAFDEQSEVECLDNLTVAAARLFSADASDIAIGSSETILMSSLAWAVMPPAGSTIVATDVTHPSTIYPWMRVAEHTGAMLSWAQSDARSVIDPDVLEDMIDENTSVVCLSHVEYGTGQTYDLKRFADAAHRHGAVLVVDATQSAGQVPIDAKASGVDALATSTYKWLCGPFGSGFMYVSPAMQKLNPGVVGWRSHKDMWDFQADRLELPNSAKRFEFGTMAYGSALGATDALNYLLEQTIDRIYAHNQQIATQLIEGLIEIGAQILGPRQPEQRSATVAAKFPGKDSAEFATTLKNENVVASLRSDFIRFSPHLYNSSGDVDKALAAIKEAM
jgi:selenocysteine lyase/cysteine desulfurase